VLLCSLTTIAGFGALIPAKHEGVSSLGLVLTLGVTNILIASVVLIPTLLILIDRGPRAAESTLQITTDHEELSKSGQLS